MRILNSICRLSEKIKTLQLRKRQKKDITDGIIFRFERAMNKEKLFLGPITEEDVCRAVGTNRYYLSRVLKEHYGLNFCQTINKFRLEHAMKLIVENPCITVYEVYNKSGFGSKSSFFRAFREHYKTNPREYFKLNYRRFLTQNRKSIVSQLWKKF